MGGYSSCHISHDHTCSTWFQDPIICSVDDRGKEQLCWNNPTRIGLYLILPMTLIPLTLFFGYMCFKWWRLHSIRSRQITYDELLAFARGRYAAGSRDYSFDSDILPYILPSCCKIPCLVEKGVVRLLLTLSLILVVLALIFIPYGLGTRTSDESQGILPDTYHLATAGYYLLVFGVIGTVFTCCLRAKESWSNERKRKYQEFKQAAHIVDVHAEPLHQMAPGSSASPEALLYDSQHQQDIY